jgi:hypothetical protein
VVVKDGAGYSSGKFMTGKAGSSSVPVALVAVRDGRVGGGDGRGSNEVSRRDIGSIVLNDNGPI